LIVLDASLVVAWLLSEEKSHNNDLLATLPDVEAVVPAHWPIEVANTLRTYVKARRLSATDFIRIIEVLDQLSLYVDSPPSTDEIGPIAEFAVANELTAYDAAYVQLALQQQAILATYDTAMRRAAQRLNIPLLPA
jgi:predicted nucleic acid-binding protein